MSTLADLPPSAKLLIGPNARSDYSVDDGGERMRLSWKVRWEENDDFLQAVVGYSQQVGGIVRTIPLRNPYRTNLYAVAIQSKTMGSDEDVSIARPWAWVHHTVDFATLPYGVDGDAAYITLNNDGSSRSVTVTGRQYAFTDGSKIQQDIGIPVGGKAITLTIHQIPSQLAFMDLADPLIGKVNSVPFTIAGKTYAAGTIYFETYGDSTQKGILGSPQTEASISLIYSALKWNQAIKPDGSVDDVSPAPFQVADLNALIV